MKWLKFIHLSWPDRLLFLKIAGLLLATRVGLILLPYKSVLGLFDRFSNAAAQTSADSMSVDRPYLDQVVFLTNAAGRRVLGSKPCLPIALVVEYLLKRQGIEATLQIGVTKGTDDKLLAHAWVEHHGEIVIGGRLSEARYARLQPLRSEDS